MTLPDKLSFHLSLALPQQWAPSGLVIIPGIIILVTKVPHTNILKNYKLVSLNGVVVLSTNVLATANNKMNTMTSPLLVMEEHVRVLIRSEVYFDS